MIVSRRFAAWVLGGVALDAIAIFGLWMGLRALGSLLPSFAHWLNGVGFVSVPWLVHVLLLPRLFHVIPPEMRGTGWLVRSVAFLGTSAMLIPVLGITAFFFVGGPLFLLLSWGTPPMGFAHPTWRDDLNGHVVVTVIAVTVGAAIGLLLHITRSGNLSGAAVPPSEPSFRSDVLGGGLAAGLIFTSTFIGHAFGWLSPSIGVSEDWAAMALPLHPAVVIVTLAMLPHLIMIGRELALRPTRNGPGQLDQRPMH